MGNDAGPVRAGIIGYGYAGRTFHAPLIAATEGIELCAIASSNAHKVAADYPGLFVHGSAADLIAAPDIDLVVVATPNETHAPLALAALAAGKHVVVDKPFALDMVEARQLVAAAQASARHLCVFHNRRWDSDYLSVKAVIESGMLGDVVHLESRLDRFRPQVRDRWRERAAPGAGVWFDLGPHLVDQVLQIFGLPDRITANLAAQRQGACVNDWAHVILDFGERRAVLQASMSVAGGSHRFAVHGSAGSLVKRKADRQEEQLISGMVPGSSGWGKDADAMTVYHGDGRESSVPVRAGDQREFYRQVVLAASGSGRPPVRPIEALAVMEVLEAAARSFEERRSVPIRLSSDEVAAWHMKDPA
ncbi:oxidoreductase [Novosphingobium sp. 9U]|uniref:oxidoreductase n=1 Tax=Novosphingobium sp. 9U TaxID=2653158 RepID=UPI0012F1C400|nr:oxidoreductase [Novosphingobium sp. 9U]VWX54551.1 Uncharacterized oxidoreductase YdgJ [Novosphingobium sp. 9U]